MNPSFFRKFACRDKFGKHLPVIKIIVLYFVEAEFTVFTKSLIIEFLQKLFNTIQQKAKSKEKKSYTKALLKSGKNKIAQKVSEESSELIIDYLNGSKTFK